MLSLVRMDSTNPDFISLVKLLDEELAILDGEDHAFYAQFNKIQLLNHAVVLFENEIPVACGALKEFDQASVEIKRMYTLTSYRGKGFASRVLQELESWAKELGYTRCVLETGKRQPDAIALYKKSGYYMIPNYGQYEGMENSVCFEKKLEIQIRE